MSGWVVSTVGGDLCAWGSFVGVTASLEMDVGECCRGF